MSDPQTDPGGLNAPDPGHVMTPEQWAEVVAARDQILQDLGWADLAEPPAAAPAPAVESRTLSVQAYSDLITYVYPCGDNNFTNAYWPHLIHTVHDVECPPGLGWVRALLGPNYFGKPGEGVSVQFMVDAGDTGQGAPPGLQCWHVGGPGNQLSLGTEQAGYASYSTAMWKGTETPGATYQRPDGTTVAWTAQDNTWMAAQFERLAQHMARLNKVFGIPLVWLTDAQLQQAAADIEAGRTPTVSGHCRHLDWTASQASNTTHHDPGLAYPKDDLMARAIQIADPPPPPPPPPAFDLLEWIMTLPGTPTNATYQSVLADIGNAAAAAVAGDAALLTAVGNAATTALLAETTAVVDLASTPRYYQANALVASARGATLASYAATQTKVPVHAVKVENGQAVGFAYPDEQDGEVSDADHTSSFTD